MSTVGEQGNEKKLKIAILVPARYNSTRFPGKALYELGGTPMAKLVYSRCESTGLDTFLVSDDERICRLAKHSLLTSSECENGTARCAEAAQTLCDYDAFINVQGDMPDITAEIIQTVADALSQSSLVTVYTPMSEIERLNPNSVKLIHNQTHAIWMCRAPLSYGDQHLGVYGYSKDILAQYPLLSRCHAEIVEGLEQIRWLQHELPMTVLQVDFSGVEINSPEDAEKWERIHASA